MRNRMSMKISIDTKAFGLFRLWAISFGLLAAIGCGETKSTSNNGQSTNNQNSGSSKTIPPEYRVLAETLCMEIKTSPEMFRDNKGMSELIAEGYGAILALRGIKTTDKDITYIAEQGESALAEGIRRFEKINAMPKPPGADELFFSSFIDGFFGNVFGGYARGKDAEEKQKAIVNELMPLIVAIEKADAAQQLMGKIAEKYSAPFTPASGQIVVDFSEAWGCWGPHDWLSIYNAGPALTDITLAVELTGSKQEMRKNIHFIKSWPANTWMYARYEPGNEILGKIVGNMSVPNVQNIAVTLYSPQYSTNINYIYQGKNKDAKIAKKCKAIALTGRFVPFESGIFWDTQRGAEFTLDGVPFITNCQVKLTFDNGNKSTEVVWNIDSWEKGESKSFKTKEGQLRFDPDKINVDISFPGTGYVYKSTLEVKP